MVTSISSYVDWLLLTKIPFFTSAMINNGKMKLGKFDPLNLGPLRQPSSGGIYTP